MARDGAVGQGVLMRGVLKVRWVTVVAILLGAMAVTALARAQTTPESTPELTEEQLQILQDLPEEERQALIEQYLKSRGQGAESPTGGRTGNDHTLGPRYDERQGAPALARERRSDRNTERGGATEASQGAAGPQGATPQGKRFADHRSQARASATIVPRGSPNVSKPCAIESWSAIPIAWIGTGQLTLPGFEPITMLGLTEKLAALRLGADKDLVEFTVKVTRLDIKAAGDEALKPFGYDIFTDVTSSFAPATDVPVPSDYIVGPGDQLRVQLFGNTNRVQTFTVGRDGQVSFPQIGPIAVGGQRFSAVKSSIEDRVAQQMIGVRADVQMGETRAIRIFLLGEVEKPGSYTVSGLSTVTNALFAGGGINRVGSLRNIQLKRNGQLVRTARPLRPALQR